MSSTKIALQEKPSNSNLAAASDLNYRLRLRKNISKGNGIVVALNTNRLARKTAACKILFCSRKEKFSDQFRGYKINLNRHTNAKFQEILYIILEINIEYSIRFLSHEANVCL